MIRGSKVKIKSRESAPPKASFDSRNKTSHRKSAQRRLVCAGLVFLVAGTSFYCRSIAHVQLWLIKDTENQEARWNRTVITAQNIPTDIVRSTSDPSEDATEKATTVKQEEKSTTLDNSGTIEVIRRGESFACSRKCSNWDSKIFYGHAFPAGVYDRMIIMKGLSDLAGYLCATVDFPSPRNMLAEHHNFGQRLSRNLTWQDDFWTVKFHDSNSPAMALHQVQVEQFPREADMGRWARQKKGGYGAEYTRDTTISTIEYEESSPHFDRLRELSRRGTKFLWNIYIGYFDLNWYLEDDWEHNKNETEIQDWPLWGCSYSQNPAIVPRLKRLANKLWNQILSDHSASIVGYIHIRRGDTIDTCNTSLARVQSYAECSFESLAPDSVTLLVGTDERDPEYLMGLLQVLGQVPAIQSTVHVDTLAWNLLRDAVQDATIPPSYMNNHHLFILLKEIFKEVDFKVQLRRSHCEDCDRVDLDLRR